MCGVVARFRVCLGCICQILMTKQNLLEITILQMFIFFTNLTDHAIVDFPDGVVAEVHLHQVLPRSDQHGPIIRLPLRQTIQNQVLNKGQKQE